MAIDRRRVLKVGGAAVVVAGAGLVWRAYDRGVFSAGSGAAYEPWKTWDSGQPGDLLRLVRAAILAANPHNSQPWLFRLGSDTVDVFADTARNIGSIDPVRREMYMGVGCAIENLRVAAAQDGYEAAVALMPDAGNAAHAARIHLTKAAPALADLYEAIPRRHTNRAAYDMARPVSAAQLSELAALATGLQNTKVVWFTSVEDRKRIGDLIVAATEAIIADPQQSGDSARWFRWQHEDILEHRDGLTMDAQALRPLINFAVKVLPRMSNEQADDGWLKATREVHVLTAAAFGFIVVSDPADPASRLRGGQLWQRLHLRATAMGLAAHPLNQMAERADRERQLGIDARFGKALQELAGGGGSHVLMPFRIGYPTIAAGASPRRDVLSVLVKS